MSVTYRPPETDPVAGAAITAHNAAAGAHGGRLSGMEGGDTWVGRVGGRVLTIPTSGPPTWAAAAGGGAVASVNGFAGAVVLAASDVGAQPTDADLTAIAALVTTGYGRAFLALADAAAGRTALGLGTAATQATGAFDAAGAAAAAQSAAIAASQPLDSDLTAIAALTTTTFGRGLLAMADAAATKTALALTSADVGLANVNNTSDAAKPVSTAQQARQDRLAREAWRPTGTFETFARLGAAMANVGVLSTGRLSAVAGVVLPGGVPVNTISFFSGTTAVVTPTNQWFCLLDASLNVLAKTVDDTTTAWAANVKKSLALSATYTPGAVPPFYVGIMVAAATVPSLSGVSPVVAGSVINALAPITSGISTTGLTNPASLGATAAALTAIAATPYAQVS